MKYAVLKLLKSFVYAFRGIGLVLMLEQNLRIHLVAVAVITTFNTMADFSAEHWCIELLCCMIVISLEFLNSAVEQLCDRITLDADETIRRVKDMSAGAVLIAAMGAAVIAVLLFFSVDSYYLNVINILQTKHWVDIALICGVIAAAVFVFLPTIIMNKKET